MEIADENYLYYLPTRFIDSSYSYVLQDNYVLINKGTNCYSQYNTTYCDCVRVYPSYNFISGSTYSCSLNNQQTIDYTNFSNDIFNYPNFSNLFIIYFIIIFIFVYILKLLFNVFRKRSV